MALQRVLEPEVMDTAAEAESYDAMDHSEPNAAFVARLVELGARGRMLDIGCGPGHIPPLVCAAIDDAHVTGVDLARHMLDRAEQHRAVSPHRERIAYQAADAKGLDFEAGAFDTVYSNTILHHIPDPRPFLREASRVLAPNGTLLIRDLYRPESIERLDALVGEHAAGADGEQRELLRASLHAAFTPAELRDLARECGLTDCEVHIDSDRHVSLERAAPVAAPTGD